MEAPRLFICKDYGWLTQIFTTHHASKAITSSKDIIVDRKLWI